MNTTRKFNTQKQVLSPTIFASFTDKNPKGATWNCVVETISQNALVKSHTDTARTYLSQNNQKLYSVYKAQSGAFTPAAFCEGGHSTTNIKYLTGIAMVDLDHLPSIEALNTALKAIKSDPHTFIAYITCSGLGIRILAPYTASEPQVAYLDAWRWVNEYYKMLTGYDYDPATKDASRLKIKTQKLTLIKQPLRSISIYSTLNLRYIYVSSQPLRDGV